MCQHRCSIFILLVAIAMTTIGLQRIGWLDRVVLYNKQKLFQELGAMVPLNINLTLRPPSPAFTAAMEPKPEGYEDSHHWDYDSVIRLLTLIRESETAQPVHKALRRMLRPTRRIMMSMKQSKHRFPSIQKDDNDFYYDERYSSSEENALPAAPPVPEDQVVLSVSNPVEARLPSARISVKLLRDILEARARAARQLPSTMKTIPPWLEFVKTRSTTPAAPDSDEKSNPESDEENKTTPKESGTDGENNTKLTESGIDGEHNTTPDGAETGGESNTTPNGTDNTGTTNTTPNGTDNTGTTNTTPNGAGNTGASSTTPNEAGSTVENSTTLNETSTTGQIVSTTEDPGNNGGDAKK